MTSSSARPGVRQEGAGFAPGVGERIETAGSGPYTAWVADASGTLVEVGAPAPIDLGF